MKKFILNKIKAVAVAGALLFALNAGAVTQVFTIIASTTGAYAYTNLVNEGTRIKQISIQNNSGNTNLTWYLLDGPKTNPANNFLEIGLSAITNYIIIGSYTTNIGYTRTNYNGIVQNITNSNVRYSYTNTTPGYTNFWRVLSAGTTSSNGAITTIVFPEPGIPAVYGIGWSNTVSPAASRPIVTIEHYPMLDTQ